MPGSHAASAQSIQEEALLKAAAQAKGLTPDAFVRQILDKVLAEASAPPGKPKKSAYGLLAKYGPGPSEQEIEENRREMFRGFGEELGTLTIARKKAS